MAGTGDGTSCPTHSQPPALAPTALPGVGGGAVGVIIQPAAEGEDGAAPKLVASEQGLTHQPEPFLSLKPSKLPTTWDTKCSR
jgi:hypothetical protein